MYTRKIKIPDKLKPLLYFFVLVMAIFLTHNIIITSFYQDLANPNNAEYHLALAETYTKQMQEIYSQDGKWDVVDGRLVYQPGANTLSLALKALQEYHKAIELNPSQARSHLLLAWHYGTLHDLIPPSPSNSPQPNKPNKPDQLNQPNQPDKLNQTNKPNKPNQPSLLSAAQREFQLALQLDSGSSYAHQVFATWAFNQAKNDRSWLKLAVREYRKAIAFDPSLAPEALTQYFPFTQNYDRLKDILPNTNDAIITLANFLYDKGAWEENQPAFMAEMEQLKADHQPHNPLNPEEKKLNTYYHTLATIYGKKGEYDRAIAILQEYLELEPSNAEAHFWLADYSFYHGSNYGYPWAFSKLHHKKAVELAPDNAFFRKWYGRHLYYQKEFKEAADQLRKAVEQNHKDDETRSWLEECYQQAAEYGLSSLIQ